MNRYFAKASPKRRKLSQCSSAHDCGSESEENVPVSGWNLPEEDLPAPTTTPLKMEVQGAASTLPEGSDLKPDPPRPAESEAELTCALECCDLSKPDPSRLTVAKKETVKEYGKRKRYFQDEWLDTFSWLVLCKTRKRAFCQICRYAIHSGLVRAKFSSKYGHGCFFKSGFQSWKDGAKSILNHSSSKFHNECWIKVQRELQSAPADELQQQASLVSIV